MNQQNDYQFVMIPQQLSSCLDANCGKMLTTLLGLSSLMKKEDGWFYRSNKELQLDTRFSQNLVIATLDTLYQAGIINVDCIGKGRGHRSNRIHINFESFKVYQQYSFNDIRNNPDLWIETVSYKNHYSPSYCKDKGKEIGNSLGKGIGKKVTTNTDTTDSSYITYTTDTKENNIISKEDTIEDEKKNNTEEPTAIKNNIHMENTEKHKEDCIFFKQFLDNPTKDYSGLLGDVSSFVKMNLTELNTLNFNLTKFHNQEPSTKYVLDNLQYYYLQKIGKDYQEVTEPAQAQPQLLNLSH